MRILGIDPGLQLTGYGCVESRRGWNDPKLVEAGVIRLERHEPIARRLAQLDRDLAEILAELQPDILAVEQIFTHTAHVRTGILMGHARGVILLAAGRERLPLVELMPTAVKKALTGGGHAGKKQMQLAVMARLGLAQVPEPADVADAIAIAVTALERAR